MASEPPKFAVADELMTAQVPPGAELHARCYTGFPPFVKLFYNSKEKEQDMFIELAELPAELKPKLEKALPFNFQEEAWQRNLQTPIKIKSFKNGAEVEEEELPLIEQVPYHFKELFLAPHAVYPGVFFMLLNSSAIAREKPIANAQEAAEVSFRSTASIFEMYRLYCTVLFWFEGHFMYKQSAYWKKRTDEVLKRRGARLRELMSTYQRRLLFLPNRREITRKVSSGEVRWIDMYSEEIAEKFAQLSFQYCVGVINSMELAIMELMQFDIDKCVANKFLTIDTPPAAEDISPVVKEQILSDMITFVTDICNASVEDKLYHFDVEHIKSHPTSAKWILSPSFFYQSFFFAVIGDALPESKAIDAKDATASASAAPKTSA